MAKPMFGIVTRIFAGWTVHLIAPSKRQTARLIAILVTVFVLVAILHRGLTGCGEE